MLSSKKKYQIAISVAEEDLSVANSIAASLKKLAISYYLYTEHAAENWGQHILRTSLDTYGAEAQYVLMITSKIYVEKYWANIERQIAEISKSRREVYMLQLRLDDTPVDGLSKYIVYQEWNNNPDEIASLLKDKLTEKKRKIANKIGISIVITFALLLGCFWFIRESFHDKKVNSDKIDNSVSLTIEKDTNRQKNEVPHGADNKPIVVNNIIKPNSTTNTNSNAKQPNSNKQEYIPKTSEPIQLNDYCVVIDGNNKIFNGQFQTQVESVVKARSFTIGKDCTMAEKKLTIFLTLQSAKSETAADIISSACSYQINISSLKGNVIAGDAGRIALPGFSEQANNDDIINQIINKLTQLL